MKYRDDMPKGKKSGAGQVDSFKEEVVAQNPCGGGGKYSRDNAKEMQERQKKLAAQLKKSY